MGKRLGALLALRDLDTGSTWAFVPGDAPTERIEKFNHYLFEGDARTAADDRLATWIEQLLSSTDGRGVVCFSEPLAQRHDPWLERDDGYRWDLFSCGPELYWFMTAGQADDSVAGFVAASLQPPVTVGMVTTLPSSIEGLRDGQEVSLDSLAEMAANARAILVDAWDTEGVVVWEPAASRGARATAR
jgi:hypothetical protein